MKTNEIEIKVIDNFSKSLKHTIQALSDLKAIVEDLVDEKDVTKKNVLININSQINEAYSYLEKARDGYSS